MDAALQQLIAEYNEIEAQQAARSRAIINAVISADGYHRLAFSSGDVWANLNQLREPGRRGEVEQLLSRHVHLITKAE